MSTESDGALNELKQDFREMQKDFREMRDMLIGLTKAAVWEANARRIAELEGEMGGLRERITQLEFAERVRRAEEKGEKKGEQSWMGAVAKYGPHLILMLLTALATAVATTGLPGAS